MGLLDWLWRLMDRGHPIQYGPLDEEPPPITRNWGDAVSNVREIHPNRPRPMDKPRRYDNRDGLDWPTDEDD